MVQLNTHRSECRVTTPAPPEFVDITPDVARVLSDSEVGTGLVTVAAPPGCTLIVNEFESGLLADLKRTFLDLEARGNGSRPRIGSSSVVLPARDGRLLLGRWQRLLLVELEAAAERSVAVQIVGE